MTSIEHLSGLVINLTELEFQSFLEGIKDHIRKDDLTQVVNNVLGELKADDTYELEKEIDDLKDEISDIETERDKHEDVIDEAKKALPAKFSEMTEKDFDELKSILS